jgi:hypothetical protein
MEPQENGSLVTPGPTVMNPRLRAKFLHTMDGDFRLKILMWYIHEHRQCERILDWCIVNQVIGRDLVTFLQDNGNSILEVIKQIVRRIERDGMVRPLIVGRDIRR